MAGAAIMMMALVLYWVLGMTWGLVMALGLFIEDQEIDWGALGLTVMAWPVSVWASITGERP